MKERPIIFNTSDVQAILDGRKTQTRREVKGAGLDWLNSGFEPKYVAAVENNLCPFGQPGDRLWVREAFGYEVRSVGGTPHEQLVYRASKPDAVHCYDCNGMEQPMKWRPSIHMPRAESRILLEVTKVRIERLHDISEDDAVKEGVVFTDFGLTCFHQGSPRDVGSCPAPDSHHQKRNGWYWEKADHQDLCYSKASYAFQALWNSIYDNWGSNPWIWVVEFKVIQQSKEAA